MPKSDHTWSNGPGWALSDFYHKFKGSEWDPWEIFLMRSTRCKSLIMRDEITANNLNKKKIDAKYFGNPMMDFVDKYNKKICQYNKRGVTKSRWNKRKEGK